MVTALQSLVNGSPRLAEQSGESFWGLFITVEIQGLLGAP